MHTRATGATGATAVALWVAGATAVVACSAGEGGGGGGSGARATIGASCDIGVSAADPTVVTLNPAASECASKICLLPAQERSTTTAPFCSDVCRSDDDCVGGQQRGSGPDDRRCQSGFVCRALLPRLASNPLSCQALCVCRDFLPSSDPPTVPPSCL